MTNNVYHYYYQIVFIEYVVLTFSTFLWYTVFPRFSPFIFIRVLFFYYPHFLFFSKSIFTCIIFSINFNIVKFLKIFFVVIIYAVILTDISYMRTIFTLIISVRILCFCMIMWSQMKSGWLKFVFTWLASSLTAYIQLFLICFFSIMMLSSYFLS